MGATIGNTYTTGEVSGANPSQAGVTTGPNALVLVFLGCNAIETSGSAYSVSDNSGQGLTWTRLLGPPGLASGQGMYVFGASTSAGFNNVTISVTPSGQNSSYAGFMTVEVDGSAIVGGTPVAVDGSAFIYHVLPTTVTVTTTFQNDIILAFYLDQAGGASTYTPGASYTTAIATGTWQSQIGTVAAIEYLNVTSAGAQTVPTGSDTAAGTYGFYAFGIPITVTASGTGSASASILASGVAAASGGGRASASGVSTASIAASAGGGAISSETFGSNSTGEGEGQASASVLLGQGVTGEGKGKAGLILGGPTAPIISSSVAAPSGGGQATASVSTGAASNTGATAAGHASVQTVASSVIAGEGAGAALASIASLTSNTTATGGGQASAAVSSGAPSFTNLFSTGSALASIISSGAVFATGGGSATGVISNSGTKGVHVKALLVTKGYAKLTATKD
jgi:hypothetical protein